MVFNKDLFEVFVADLIYRTALMLPLLSQRTAPMSEKLPTDLTSRKNPLFGCPRLTYLNLVVAQIKLFQSWDRLETLGAADSVAAHVQLFQAR